MNADFWIYAQKCWRKTMDSKEYVMIDEKAGDTVIEMTKVLITNPYSKNLFDEEDDEDDEDDEED